MWCIGKIDGEYLARMEDVLEIYKSEKQKGVSRICFDERPCQLIGDVYSPIPMKAEKVRKIDNEYERKGTCVILLAYDLDRGQRYFIISDQRRKEDYAKFMDWIEKTYYSKEDKIIVVQDNLNTHKYGSFYENLPVERACELRKKLEFHFTPIHGSWLNMAEIEFSSLSRQCLDRRISSKDEMIKEVSAWQKPRNENQQKISWSFTVPTARYKMKRHYKDINSNN